MPGHVRATTCARCMRTLSDLPRPHRGMLVPHRGALSGPLRAHPRPHLDLLPTEPGSACRQLQTESARGSVGLARVSVMASAHCGGQGRDHGNSCWDFLLHDDSCIKGRVQDSALVSRELLQAPWHAHPLSDSWRRLQGAEGDPSLHPQTTAPKARTGTSGHQDLGAKPQLHVPHGTGLPESGPPAAQQGRPIHTWPVSREGRGMPGMMSGRTSPGGVWPSHAPGRPSSRACTS